ncbi:MAG: COX15/CtaA family protein [Bacteroidia bacterium]
MFREKFFNKVCFLSAVSVFLLFILGGLVRSTGSGMGCPDWPRCFGKAVPPTDESQLPENYKEQFLEKRLKKAERFTQLLNNLGFHKLAEKVKNDPQLKIAHPYNRKTAYIEWINRLFGALTGIFALLSIISGFAIRKEKSKQFRWVLFGTFWVIFNGWLGSVVVQTNLVPGIVTVHYAAAYLAMGGFIFALPKNQNLNFSSLQTHLLFASLLLLITEIFLGTTTREIIDTLKQNDNFELNARTVWIPGLVFSIHRLLGIILFGINLYFFYSLKKSGADKILLKFQTLIIFLFTLQIASGFTNVFYDIPALVNVIHISASAGVVGLQLWMMRNRLKPIL